MLTQKSHLKRHKMEIWCHLVICAALYLYHSAVKFWFLGARCPTSLWWMKTEQLQHKALNTGSIRCIYSMLGLLHLSPAAPRWTVQPLGYRNECCAICTRWMLGRCLGKKQGEDSSVCVNVWVTLVIHLFVSSESREMDHCAAGLKYWRAELQIRKARLAEALCKYPSGLRKTEEGSWGGRGKRMDCGLIWTKQCFSQGLWLWTQAWCQMLHKQLLCATKWSN